VVVWGVGNVELVVVLVVRCMVFGAGWGVVVFSMFLGFGVQRVGSIVGCFVFAIFNSYLVVGCMMALLGVLYFRSPLEFLVLFMLPFFLTIPLFPVVGYFHLNSLISSYRLCLGFVISIF
jgi:uncharacterized membrane-anchored protein